MSQRVLIRQQGAYMNIRHNYHGWHGLSFEGSVSVSVEDDLPSLDLISARLDHEKPPIETRSLVFAVSSRSSANSCHTATTTKRTSNDLWMSLPLSQERVREPMQVRFLHCWWKDGNLLVGLHTQTIRNCSLIFMYTQWHVLLAVYFAMFARQCRNFSIGYAFEYGCTKSSYERTKIVAGSWEPSLSPPQDLLWTEPIVKILFGSHDKSGGIRCWNLH